SEGGGYLLSSATPLTIATALELPSTSAALANPSNTPVAGQRNVLMNPNQVVVSRPGFTTASTGRNLILDSGRIPAKIIASGEVRIAAGASVTVASPVTLRPTAYVDYHVKAASVAQWTHPPLQTGSLTSKVTIPFRWRINAGSVQMQNQASFAIDVRYMILADDSQQTSGGSEWMRKIGNEWQIKRPGSSDSNPALSDIMIDTRFSYVPILDEGYIPISQFTEAPTNLAYGQKAQTINFDLPPGMVPFVKFVVRMQYTYEDDFTSPTLMQGYREPVSELFMGQIESQAGGGAYLGRQSSLGTVAHITNGSVKFHVAHTNPYMLNFNSAGDIEAMFGSAERPIGIRYFIYGIPNS
ncbi:MAG TPA: hypothetical protein VMF90_03140, partial [Rhizobiaceae bacterium]|nr:hypothetical protein [Rhizobiaceae bacterium]